MKDGAPIPAMPELDDILSEIELSRLVDTLSEIDIHQYDSSITVHRDVRRVPLKVSSRNEIESEHQQRSYDGLGVFVLMRYTLQISRVGRDYWKLSPESKILMGSDGRIPIESVNIVSSLRTWLSIGNCSGRAIHLLGLFQSATTSFLFSDSGTHISIVIS